MSHSYPPMNYNIAPMPTQNPWVGMGMGTQCRALPVTNTLQALTLVVKEEPVEVRFILRLRDQRSI